MRRVGARAALLLLLGWLVSCGFVVGEEQLDITQVGQVPLIQSPLIVSGALKESTLMRGADGVPWIASHPAKSGTVQLSRLLPPYLKRTLLLARSLFSGVPAQSVCTLRHLPGQAQPYLVGFQRPDDAATTEFNPPYTREPRMLCGQKTLVYWLPTEDATHIEVARRQPDGSVKTLRLPWPARANPDWDQGPQGFDADESVLVVLAGDYRTHLYSLDTGEDVDLGVHYLGGSALGMYIYVDIDGYLHSYDLTEQRTYSVGFRLSPDGNLLGVDATRGELLTCDWDGVRSVELKPRGGLALVARQRVLDAEPCTVGGSTLLSRTERVDYYHNQELRSVMLDGKSRPKTLLSSLEELKLGQLLSVCRDQAVAYSLDPPERYGPGAGDGWIGARRFMERGRDARFSQDCSRLFFKEHAATLRKLGELRLQELPAVAGESWPRSLLLARNVGFFQLLPDGRLIAATDLAVLGPHNRVELIDQQQQSSSLLLRGVGAVTNALQLGPYFPGSREILLEVDQPELTGDRRLLFFSVPLREEPVPQ